MISLPWLKYPKNDFNMSQTELQNFETLLRSYTLRRWSRAQLWQLSVIPWEGKVGPSYDSKREEDVAGKGQEGGDTVPMLFISETKLNF